MLKLRERSDFQPRCSSGAPHQRTTGVASANCSQPLLGPVSARGNPPSMPPIASATQRHGEYGRPSEPPPHVDQFRIVAGRCHRHGALERHAAPGAGAGDGRSRRPGTSDRRRALRLVPARGQPPACRLRRWPRRDNRKSAQRESRRRLRERRRTSGWACHSNRDRRDGQMGIPSAHFSRTRTLAVPNPSPSQRAAQPQQHCAEPAEATAATACRRAVAGRCRRRTVGHDLHGRLRVSPSTAPPVGDTSSEREGLQLFRDPVGDDRHRQVLPPDFAVRPRQHDVLPILCSPDC